MRGQLSSLLGWIAGWQAAGAIAALLLAGLAVLAATMSIRRRQRRPALAAPPAASPEQQLLTIAGEMLCLHDAMGIIRSVSGAIREVTGMEPGDIIGLRLDDFVHLDDRLSLLSLWGRLTAGHDVAPAEFRFIQPGGETIWIEGRFAQMADPSGAVVYGSALRDVTRQRLAENDLREIRDDLTSGIAAGQGTLYRLALHSTGKWRPIFFAANIERVTGYTVSEAMGANFLDDLLSLPNRALRKEALERAIEDGNGTAEYDFPTKSGAIIRVRDHFRRWDRSDGTIEIVGYLVDTTEAHSNELRIRKVQEEVAAVVLEGPGMLYRTVVRSMDDRDILFVSGNVKALTGFSPEQMTTPGWYAKYVPADVRTLEWKNIRRAIHIGSCSYEYRYLNVRGEWRWNRNNIRHVMAGRRHHELVGYMMDITEEKERAIHMAQASKLATLGELATSMAHELSQPLASISMAAENAQLSLEANPGNVEVVTQKLGRISQQAIRASKLVDHMRMFGRRDGGEARPVSLAVALDGALTIADGRLRKTKTAVDCDIEADLPQVMGSLVLIEQVLMNLITNACDAFTSAQTPVSDERRRIEIKMASRGDMIVITVADHAGGIQNADLSKIFEPFFTTKPPGEGTGLGLSISYGIVSDMGGTMRAFNRDGGAVFEIALPKLADAPAPGAAAPSLPALQPAHALSGGG